MFSRPVPAASRYRLLCDSDGYARPPQPAEKEKIERALRRLGQTMLDDPPEGGLQYGDEDTLASAGFNYLGQFVDHDLSFDATTLSAAGLQQVSAMVNQRQARLDLGHVYGGGPARSPWLYEKNSPPGIARFRLGTTPEGRRRDLPRTDTGEALTGDGRHEENLILSQLFVAFLRFHNAVLDAVLAGRAPECSRGGTPFEQARRLVTWHYQWIVVQMFLRTILDAEIWEETLLSGPGPIFAPRGLPDPDFALPLEFTMAAFRYGHTAVRHDYLVNHRLLASPERPHRGQAMLAELLHVHAKLAPNAAGNLALRDDWIIDWGFYFDDVCVGVVPGAAATQGMSTALFNTRLAGALFHIPPEPHDPTLPPELSVRTLLRGYRVGLPSGQRVAQTLGVETILRDEAITADREFLDLGFGRETPLFYYLLKEAETLGPLPRRRLGPLGSHLVGKTILAALLADENSYFYAPDPDHPAWFLDGRASFGMRDLLAVAGVTFPDQP